MKKGFTLIELLAVVAIMAMLVIMLAPNIINTFNNTKKQNFISETREVCRTATNTYLRHSITSYDNVIYNNIETNPANKLDLQGRAEFKYIAYVNTDGEVIGLLTYDGTNTILVVNANGIEPNSIDDRSFYSINVSTLTFAEKKELVGVPNN